MDVIKADEFASCNIERHRKFDDVLRARGHFKIEIVRKDGRIEQIECDNLVTNVGKNHMLDVEFHGVAAVATWYIGLVDNSGFTAFAAGDTMSSHGGWTESQAYTEATRPAWPEDAAASQSITNSTVVTFTINATVTIKGVFVTSDSAKGGTAGTLWAGVAFASNQALANADLLKVTYTVSLT